MSNPFVDSWFDSFRPPRISSTTEKVMFAGDLVSAVFYGIIVVLFFQCMNALLDPPDRMRGIKWVLVAHTAMMFLFATIFTATTLAMRSIGYIDNREFDGINGRMPGPIGYLWIILNPRAINIISDTMFLFNNWLADGILLYRCFVIYSRNYWAIVFPCLMYITSIGMGLTWVYMQPGRKHSKVLIVDSAISYFSISLSLNLLLTLMIIVRLVRHNRSIRGVGRAPVGTLAVCKVVITMIIESFALYAGSSILLFVVRPLTRDGVQLIFFSVLAASQVIAPFLITLQVANRGALTSENVAINSSGSTRLRSQESILAVGSGSIPEEYPMSLMGRNKEVPGAEAEEIFDHKPLHGGVPNALTS